MWKQRAEPKTPTQQAQAADCFFTFQVISETLPNKDTNIDPYFILNDGRVDPKAEQDVEFTNASASDPWFGRYPGKYILVSARTISVTSWTPSCICSFLTPMTTHLSDSEIVIRKTLPIAFPFSLVHAGPAFERRNSFAFPQSSFNFLAKQCWVLSSRQYLTSSRNWLTKIKELLIGHYICDQYGNNTVASPNKLLVFRYWTRRVLEILKMYQNVQHQHKGNLHVTA